MLAAEDYSCDAFPFDSLSQIGRHSLGVGLSAKVCLKSSEQVAGGQLNGKT